ncbi:MAG: hypothetical protein AMXMBFR33_59540 [Candidatus Xenobia bacterium]
MADSTIPGVSQIQHNPPPRRSALQSSVGPHESYQTGVQPPQLIPPPKVHEPPAQARSGFGKGLALGVGLTLVGLIGAGVVIQTREPPPLQMDQLSSQQRGALRDLRSLQEISAKYGGGLRQEAIIGTRAATPERALQELMQGDPVFYVHAEGAQPLRIDTFQQLDQLQSHVARQDAKRQIQEGLDQIREGMREAGEAIGRELEDFWKEVRKP